MKDPERLMVSGDKEARRLLAAARELEIPHGIKEQVRLAVDGRRRPSRRSARAFFLAGAGLVATATAVAAIRALERPAPRTPAASSMPVPHQRARSIDPPLPVEPAPPPEPRKTAPPKRRPPAPAASTPASPLHTVIEQTTDSPPSSAVAAPRLLVTRAGHEEIALSIDGGRVHGQVRGTPVKLLVAARSIRGKIGDDDVVINIFGRFHASGTAAGLPLGFTFKEISGGWLVGASLPEHGGQVRAEATHLSFLPGCDRELAATAAGSYGGTCADGARLQVELPPAFTNLPEMARLVLLGMLLPVPEDVERDFVRGLFPAR